MSKCWKSWGMWVCIFLAVSVSSYCYFTPWSSLNVPYSFEQFTDDLEEGTTALYQGLFSGEAESSVFVTPDNHLIVKDIDLGEKGEDGFYYTRDSKVEVLKDGSLGMTVIPFENVKDVADNKWKNKRKAVSLKGWFEPVKVLDDKVNDFSEIVDFNWTAVLVKSEVNDAVLKDMDTPLKVDGKVQKTINLSDVRRLSDITQLDFPDGVVGSNFSIGFNSTTYTIKPVGGHANESFKDNMFVNYDASRIGWNFGAATSVYSGSGTGGDENRTSLLWTEFSRYVPSGNGFSNVSLLAMAQSTNTRPATCYVTAGLPEWTEGDNEGGLGVSNWTTPTAIWPNPSWQGGQSYVTKDVVFTIPTLTDGLSVTVETSNISIFNDMINPATAYYNQSIFCIVLEGDGYNSISSKEGANPWGWYLVFESLNNPPSCSVSDINKSVSKYGIVSIDDNMSLYGQVYDSFDDSSLDPLLWTNATIEGATVIEGAGFVELYSPASATPYVRLVGNGSDWNGVSWYALVDTFSGGANDVQITAGVDSGLTGTTVSCGRTKGEGGFGSGDTLFFNWINDTALNIAVNGTVLETCTGLSGVYYPIFLCGSGGAGTCGFRVQEISSSLSDIYCSDVDGDALAYTTKVVSGVGDINITNNDNLTAIGDGNAGVGFYGITVSDGSLSAYFDLNVTYFIVNTAPIISWGSESPSNDSHYNLSELPATFYFQASDPDVGENIAACHLSDGTVNYQSIYSVTEGVNYSLSASSFASEGLYLMRINCDDGIGNGTSSLKTVVYDVTPPDIPLISPGWPTSDNLSRALDKTSVPFNISCTDSNELWSFKINLSRAGVYYWSYYVEDINSTNIEYSTATDLSSLPNGSVLTEVVCYDSHTKQDIRPYYNEKSLTEASLSFHNSEDVIIIKAEGKEGLASLDTKRLSDRYTFIYDFSNLEGKEVKNYDFLIYSTGELHYLEGSKENAHFISLGDKVNNWIDFNLKDDKEAKYKVTYEGSNIWRVNVKTKLKTLKFESVGELNRADASARFYLGDPISLNSPVNNQVVLTESVNFNCSLEELGTPINLTLVLDNVENVTVTGSTYLEISKVLSEGYHNYYCFGTDSEGYFVNSTTVNTFAFSPNPPSVSLTTPPNNLTVLSLPVNNSLLIASSGLFLDSCYYSTSDGTVNEPYACNVTLPITFSTPGYKRIDYCANDSYLREDCDFVNFTLTYIKGSDLQERGIIGEGDVNNIYLFVNITPINATFTADSYLNWNDSFYAFNSKTLLPGGESYRFSYSFVIPNNSGTDNGNNVSYAFYYNVAEDYNNLTVNNSQVVYDLSLDDCSANTFSLLNFSLKDEETKSISDIINGTIKTTASISNSLGIILSYSTYVNVTMNTDTNVSNAEQLSICISPNVLNFSNYYLSLITEYEADERVIEYYYIDNHLLSHSTIFNTISLYDLKTEDSTSFLVTFKDNYYLPIKGAVIDALRYYTAEGDSISVEHGKTDQGGQTVLHLVAEDVLYTFIVRKDGEVVYVKEQGKALCLTTPCQINLITEEGIIKIGKIGGLENLAGSFDYDKTTRTLSYTYATTDGTTASMSLDVILNNAYLNETLCSNSQISSAGTLTCTLPPSFANTTFYANVSSGSNFVAETFFYDDNPAYTIHGSTGVLMTFFMFLTLVFMAGSDAIGMLVFGILGLALAGMLGIFGGGIIIGLGSSLLWLIVAAGIIIHKISQKRRI